jgi:thiol-disulfide isomerase/thioredoxin
MPTPDKKRTRRPRLAVATLVVAALLPGCSRLRPVKAVIAAPTPTSVTVADIRRLTKESPAKVVLVNVWATWCVPCREELPALVKLKHGFAKDGVEVMLVSADADKPMDELTAFLTSQGVDFPTYIKTESDPDFKKAMSGDWSGAIPATFVYTNGGELFDFWEGMATYETFESKAKEAMDEAPPPGPQGG